MYSPEASQLRHVLVGAGRWGSWLAWRLQDTGHDVAAIVGDRPSARVLAARLNCAHHLELSSLRGVIIWLCLPDAQLESFAEANRSALANAAGVVHASGSAALLRTDCPSGVCWPVQSITHAQMPDWSTLPFVLEASTPAFAKTIWAIAAALGNGNPQLVLAKAERQKLHLAATLTQNFGNLLWCLAAELLRGQSLDYHQLLPLAQNHLAKLVLTPPDQLQTGPAVRHDESTLRQHELYLADHPPALEIYRLLSQEIIRRSLAAPESVPLATI